MKIHGHAIALITGVLGVSTVSAQVVDADTGGFLVRNEALVAAGPDATWRALLAVGQWWDPEHTYSGDAGNMSIDAAVGGCFCERIGPGGVKHGEVIYLAPGKTLRLSSALGPLQPDGVSGSLTFSLQLEGVQTRVVENYSVGGYRQGGVGELAAAVDAVLGHQLQRLKRFIETGTPLAPAAGQTPP